VSSHPGIVLVYVLSGVVISLVGGLVVQYPEASYAIRTSWKHDDPSLSSRGRTDQRVIGAVIMLIGIGIILMGII